MQTALTVLFYLIIVAFLSLCGYVYYLDKRLSYCKANLEVCQGNLIVKEKIADLKEKNLEILKRSCERKTKPTVVDNKLKVENLFDNEPE